MWTWVLYKKAGFGVQSSYMNILNLPMEKKKEKAKEKKKEKEQKN